MGRSFDPWGLLFPRKCLLCGKLLLPDEDTLCQWCSVQTAQYEAGERKVPGIREVTALWLYEGPVRDALLRYKFRGKRHYGAAFGKLLGEQVEACFQGSFDVIVYVPVSRQRKWKRGYDQVLLLARAMGKELGRKPVRALKKLRDNPAQSALENGLQRRENVRGVYRVTDPRLIAGKRVLLVDDIITTGATAAECGKLLRAAGAKEVLCAAVAVTQGRYR